MLKEAATMNEWGKGDHGSIMVQSWKKHGSMAKEEGRRENNLTLEIQKLNSDWEVYKLITRTSLAKCFHPAMWFNKRVKLGNPGCVGTSF